MSKKYQILKCLDDYGTANITDLFARVDTGQTQAQLRTYLSVMQTNDGTVRYNPETMRFSLTDEGEKYLVNPPTIGRKKSAGHKTANPQSPIIDKPKPEHGGLNVDAIPDEAMQPGKISRPEKPNGRPEFTIRQPATEVEDPEDGINKLGVELEKAQELIDKIDNEFGETGTHLEPVATENPIDHPPHYTDHPSGVECIQITEHMNFNLGNAIKYIWRAGLKGRQKQDLEKARWYIQREIERLEAAK